MKKYLLFVFALFVCCFFGCDQPNQSKDDGDSKIEIPFTGTYYYRDTETINNTGYGYDDYELTVATFNNNFYTLERYDYSTTDSNIKNNYVVETVIFKITNYNEKTQELSYIPDDLMVEKSGKLLSEEETLAYLKVREKNFNYDSIDEYIAANKEVMIDNCFKIEESENINIDGSLFTKVTNCTAEDLLGTWKSFYEREATESWPFNLVELTFKLNTEFQVTMQADFYFVSGAEKTLLKTSSETANLLDITPLHLICIDYEEKEIDYTTTPPTEESRTESSSFIDYVFNGDTLEVSDFIFTKS